MLTHLVDLWRQPPSGLAEAQRAWAPAAWAKLEAMLGVVLPAPYRMLMSIQNGGSLRRHRLGTDANDELDELEELLPMPRNRRARTPFLAALWASIDRIAPMPELLPIARFSNGTLVCLDLARSTPIREPTSVLLGPDDQRQACGSLATLLAALRPADVPVRQHYLGITATVPFADLVTRLATTLALDLRAQTHDRHGSFGFPTWYETAVPLHLDDTALRTYAAASNITFDEVRTWAEQEGRTRSIQAVLSPNRHDGGTHLFPSSLALTAVLEIRRPWFDPTSPIQGLTAQLSAVPEITSVIDLGAA